MEKAAWIGLTMALGLSACASTRECDQKIADLEQQLREKDNEVHRLRTDEANIAEMSNANRTLSKKLQDEIAKGQLTVSQLRNRLTISVIEEVLFSSGSVDLHADGKGILDRVADVLKSIDSRLIMVEGHTDDVAIGPKLVERYPTNWELSTARAATVVRYLQSRGVAPKHLGAAGFSEYRSLAPNDSAANRQRNRRIDVVLTPEIQEKTPD